MDFYRSQNYETRQKYENQLCQLQNKNLELQEITHFIERLNILDTLMQDIDKNLEIEEQQMSDEKRKELQSQALKLQKIGEDYLKELSKLRRMAIFFIEINSKILQMSKVYIRNTQNST
ncbi:PREDICTED: uncharacterized protein LOC105460158, partial [Wasmannia auropunctata]|uniref:uncharacterized protein LOC105460158 n=1 Tax=Wasmannia auropunctata TaxID=64793 RepID=UPI0005EE07E0